MSFGGVAAFACLIVSSVLIHYKLIPWYIGIGGVASILLVGFISKVIITYRGYDLAVAYKKAACCQCIACGYALAHKHEPCPECGDQTTPAERDAWWDTFLKLISGEDAFEPGKVPLAGLPPPTKVFQHARRRYWQLLGVYILVSIVLIADAVYLRWFSFIPSLIPVVVVGFPSTMLISRRVHFAAIAQTYVAHRLEICLRCGKSLPHAHAHCPHCGDHTSPPQRDAEWKRILKFAWLPMYTVPPIQSVDSAEAASPEVPLVNADAKQ